MNLFKFKVAKFNQMFLGVKFFNKKKEKSFKDFSLFNYLTVK